jgi:hypothetical protein
MGGRSGPGVNQAVIADVKHTGAQAITDDDASEANGASIRAHFAMTWSAAILVCNSGAGVAG